MKNKPERISNPFPPVVDENAHVLILGSLPSEASRAAGFYYMNPRNRFWGMLSALLDENFEKLSAPEKKDALLRHGIALSDVVLSCEIHRSADATIKNVVSTDVKEILSRSAVKHIFLNGQKAYSLFLRYFPEYQKMATCLPSTSPANAKTSFPVLVKTWGEALLPYLK